jgi:hypothetical protein
MNMSINGFFPAAIAMALAALPAACVVGDPSAETDPTDNAAAATDSTGNADADSDPATDGDRSPLAVRAPGVAVRFSGDSTRDRLYRLSQAHAQTYWRTATWPTMYLRAAGSILTGREVNRETEVEYIDVVMAIDSTKPGRYRCGPNTNIIYKVSYGTKSGRTNTVEWRPVNPNACDLEITRYGAPGQLIVGKFYVYLVHAGVVRDLEGTFEVTRENDLRGSLPR